MVVVHETLSKGVNWALEWEEKNALGLFTLFCSLVICFCLPVYAVSCAV